MGIEKNITSIRTEVIGSMKSFILSSTVLTVSWEKAENDDNVKTKNKKNLLSFFIKSVCVSPKYMNLTEGTTIKIK